MEFLKTFILILALMFVFMFFGGFMLLDFRNHPYIALVTTALIIAVIVRAFISQENKIEELKRRVDEQESPTKSK